MKVDLFTKVVLTLVAVLLFLNVVMDLFASKPALAVQEGAAGRYQISAWAAPLGAVGAHHSGYYVLDTVTGKVIDKFEDRHEISK